MSAISINHINLRAPSDLVDRLRDFYCAALDLYIGTRPAFKSQGYWLYAANVALIHLTVAGEEECRSTGKESTLDHVAFTCDDFDKMTTKLTALNIQFQSDSVPTTSIRQLFFSDPAGNGVELTFPQ